jgi:hypothetical protein
MDFVSEHSLAESIDIIVGAVCHTDFKLDTATLAGNKKK